MQILMLLTIVFFLIICIDVYDIFLRITVELYVERIQYRLTQLIINYDTRNTKTIYISLGILLSLVLLFKPINSKTKSKSPKVDYDQPTLKRPEFHNFTLNYVMKKSRNIQGYQEPEYSDDFKREFLRVLDKYGEISFRKYTLVLIISKYNNIYIYIITLICICNYMFNY